MLSLGKLRPRTLWAAPSGPGWGPLPEMLLTLTLVTGLVDAVSILVLGRVFVANMTGNVVFAGFAIAGAPGFSLGASLFALAGFSPSCSRSRSESRMRRRASSPSPT